MLSPFTRNNNIHWVAEKAFNQLTNNGKELFEEPWTKIYNRTLGNPRFQSAIALITSLPESVVTQYITHTEFIRCLLFSHYKSKLQVETILGDTTTVRKLLDTGYKPNKTALQIAVLNNRLDILRLLVNDNLPLSNDLLMYAVSNIESEAVYDYLIESGLTPNMSVYIRAAHGTSIRIVEHISDTIALSKTVLEAAFKTNCTAIVKFLIDEAVTTSFRMDPNLISYPIMYGNLVLLDYIESKTSIEWHDELYYPALLSGNRDTITFIETKLPDIHTDHRLDTSKTKTGKGYRSLLLDDTIYSVNNIKRMSHTVNYAIQSKSLETVQYICSLGYGITQSNIITAIRQSTTEILAYLLQQYNRPLDRYILHYLSVHSYIPDKLNKTHILLNSKLVDIDPTRRLTMYNYRQETTHIELLETETVINTDSVYDIDYLMRTMQFLEPVTGTKLNHRILTSCVIALRLDLVDILDKLYISETFSRDRKLLIDCLYLFGTQQQLQMYLTQHSLVLPKLDIIMETLCYRHYSKLMFLLQHCPEHIRRELKHAVNGVSIMLADTELLNLLEIEPVSDSVYVKFAAESGSAGLIKSLRTAVVLTKSTAVSIIKLDDVSLVASNVLDWSRLTKDDFQDLIRFAIDSDYIEVARELIKLSISQ